MLPCRTDMGIPGVVWFLCWVLFTTSCLGSSQSLPPILPTVTVRGFLNFKTTVDGTVIVFTPASEVHHHHPTTDVIPSSSTSETFPSKENFKSDMDIVQDIGYASPVQNSLDPVKTEAPILNVVENKVNDPFMQHISDNAVLPSSINDLDQMKKVQSSQNQYPTGLVTILGGTFVDGTSTTVFETKVIGTYIEGKYAQILQSTSHIDTKQTSDVVTSPILSYSTVDRSYTKMAEQEPSESTLIQNIPSSQLTPSESSQIPFSKPQESFSILSTPSLHVSSSSEENKMEVLSKIKTLDTSSKLLSIVETKTSETKLFPSTQATTLHMKPSQISQKAEISSQIQSSVPKVTSTSSHIVKPSDNKIELSSSRSRPTPNYSKTNLYSSFVPTVSFDSEEPTQTLDIRKKLTVSKITLSTRQPEETESFKGNRNNSSRTRFLSPRRPSQTVRLNRFKVKLTLRHDSADEYNVTLPADEEELEEDHTNKVDEEIEVVTDSHLTNIDPAKVVFQETTITSEVTLHVGRRKSVRTLTITTSVPLTIHPTDIQEILAAESTLMDDSDSDHHIVSRTFTTTERALKTSVVPIFDGKSTAYHTVTESFFIMKLITAYRTLPPGDASILESVFDEPEISETTLEVAANIQPSITQSIPPEDFATEEAIQPSMSTPPYVSENQQLSNPFLSLGHALSNNPLAAVYLGLQQLNAQITLYSTITDTSTYVTTETLYSTKTVRFYDGRSTRYRTVSDPTSTKKRTITTTVTSVQPYLNTQALQQQQQLQKLIAAPQLAPMEPQYSTMTSIYTTVTTTTSPSTRIYTLIYNGFSTKFRTVTSFSVFPTTVTVTSKTQIPVAPSRVNVPFAYPYTP